jgi:trigger factor
MSETTANQIEIEDAGPARKRLTITVPAEVIDDKLQTSMSTLRAETTLPGFRKGHAPQALLERRFGTTMRSETRNQIIADAYAAAIEEHQLQPVGEPEPVESMEDIEVRAGAPITFSVDVEVVPEFDVPSFDAIEVKRPVLEITDALVDEEIDRQRLQYGTPTEIKGGYQANDRFIGSGVATKKGDEEPFFQHDEIVIVFPSDEDGGRGQVLGLLIDGLDGLLREASPGQAIEIQTKGPELHEREDIRGEDITINFTVRNIQRIEPAAVEDIYQQYGLPDEQILREQIKLALEQRRDNEQASAMREQLYEQLGDLVEFDLPEKLTANQATRAVRQHEIELLYRGLTPEEVESELAEFRAQSERIARNRLKMFFLMHKLASDYGIEVTEQEINGRIAAIAASRGARPEQLRNELAQSGRLGEIATQIRMHKTADRIIQDVAIADISTDEWKKMLIEKRSSQQPATASAGKKKTTKKKTTKKKTTKKSSKKTAKKS